MLAAVRPALHPATAAKIRQCFASDACLPAQLRRSAPGAPAGAGPKPALLPSLPARGAAAALPGSPVVLEAVRALSGSLTACWKH